MSDRAVHWHEGMFLRPHHFQAAHRHQLHLLNQHVRWSQHYYWGVRRLVIDPDALAAFRFVVRELEVRLRDGSVFTLEDVAAGLEMDLKEAFQGKNRLEIRLAVPSYRSGWANVRGEADGEAGRFLTDAVPVEDENTGTNPQSLSFRSLAATLLTDTADPTGYEVLTLGRLFKSDRAEAPPEMDPDFIPALLACDGWDVLQNDILQQTYFRLKKKGEMLAAQVRDRGITLDSHSSGDALKMAQLRIINEARAVLDAICFIPGVHPLDAYRELARIVGQLAIFAADRLPPEVPHYDHDDLGRCFRELREQLDTLLDKVEDPVIQERPFIGAGFRMQVSLDPAWMEPQWRMFLGVRSTIPSEECIRMLTRPERLGMKIGSTDQVERIYSLGREGMRFAVTARPPRDLPAGLTYFELTREPPTEWKSVRDSHTLAIRLKETDLLGSIQDQKEFTIQAGPKTVTFQFTLFVLPAAE